MIIRKLLDMIRRDRPVHQVPQALRDLDRAMQLIVDEQQEAAMLAKARKTLLGNSGQPPPAGSMSVSCGRPTVPRERSISTSVALFAGTVTIVFAGIVTLIVWAPPVASWISSLTSLILIIVIAVIVGFEAGRWWAEAMRGSFEARMAWRRRKMYRQQRKKRKPVSGNAHEPH
jgi:hypothetical protein